MYRYRLVLVALLLWPAMRLQGQDTSCPMDSTAAWAKVSRAWSNEAGLKWSHDSLRRVLLALGEEDQALRTNFGAQSSDTAYVRRLMRSDSALSVRMEEILSRFGLPTRAMVGAAGSDAAMLIVQHNSSLQERVLALAKAAPAGQISPQYLALLEDRVLNHQDKPQVYGTQFTLGPDGKFRFAPTIDPTSLDARRARAGLPPMATYLCFLVESQLPIDTTSLPR